MASHTVYAVASGKGGVGKTATTVNLGASLAEAGYTVAIVDTDLGMANLGGFIGIEPEQTLHEVLAGDATLEEATYEALNGLAVVPSGISLNGFANVETASLADAVDALRDAFDYVLLDLGAGLSHDTVLPLALADAVILVSTPQPAAVQDTAKTREITERLGGRVAGVVLTRAGHDSDLEIDEVEDTLDLPVLAAIPEDEAVPASAREGKAVLQYEEDSPTVEGYRGLAGIIEEESLADAPIVPEMPEPEPEPATAETADTGSTVPEPATPSEPEPEAPSEPEPEAPSEPEPEAPTDTGPASPEGDSAASADAADAGQAGQPGPTAGDELAQPTDGGGTETGGQPEARTSGGTEQPVDPGGTQQAPAEPDQPQTDQPQTDQPQTDQPTAGESAPGQSGDGEPATEGTSSETPGGDAADEEAAAGGESGGDTQQTAAEIAAAIEDAATARGGDASVTEPDMSTADGSIPQSTPEQSSTEQPAGGQPDEDDGGQPAIDDLFGDDGGQESAGDQAAAGGTAADTGAAGPGAAEEAAGTKDAEPSVDPTVDEAVEPAGEEAGSPAAEDAGADEEETLKVESHAEEESDEAQAVDELFSVEGASPDDIDDDEDDDEDSGGLLGGLLG